MKVFVDTGPLVARILAKDPHHREALEMFRGISEGRLPFRMLYTSNFVKDEALTRLLYEAGHPAAMQGLRVLRDSTALRVVPITANDEARADEAFATFTDHRISYTDCTSLAVMERLGIETVFSFDRDFETMGVARVP